MFYNFRFSYSARVSVPRLAEKALHVLNVNDANRNGGTGNVCHSLNSRIYRSVLSRKTGGSVSGLPLEFLCAIPHRGMYAYDYFYRSRSFDACAAIARRPPEPLTAR